ncbi:MAG: type I DNA topoisomerase [Pseudomonadota bacterium]
MEKSLVIVESPAKAKTIKKYLGKGFSVLASVGHIMDLPLRELGVDVENDFSPKYVVIRGKARVLKQITDAAAKSDHVYLAPDPDREGEAIAWHIAEQIRKSTKAAAKKKGAAGKAGGGQPELHRALFNEITAAAVKAAIAAPGDLDRKLFEAQQARRILDRLVGYKISPILWEKVRRGLSAGRVQSVAVRIVCEREREIEAFVAREYWSVVANLEGSLPPPFEAKLLKIAGKDAELATGDAAKGVVAELKREKFLLSSVRKSERRRKPTPPFITSKIQQDAARKLGYTAKRTMALAQMLYEGVEIGDEGSVGLITYMRTDSVRVSDGAIEAVREYIAKKYGKESLPESPIRYQGRKGAQDAHEAIRPTSLDYPPEAVEKYLDPDAFRLYDLIWKRFVASQMNPAVYDQTAFDIEAGRYLFRATGQVLRFPGFMAVYLEGEDEVSEKDEEENPTLPDIKEGEILKSHGIEPNQHFTQPPPRFTEATLVKELEEKGIGRPSTYAAIMSTIQDKGYVRKIEKRFRPAELGLLVNDLLVTSFPEILDVGFTAQMESELDDVEDGKRGWVEALKGFYGPFDKALAQAKHRMRDVKRQQMATDIACEKCGKPMVIKWGRHGEFLACSAYPDCRSTKEFIRTDEGEVKAQEAPTTDEKCEKCGSPMAVKRGRFGPFLACTNYPTCKTTRSIGTGIACPECEKGKLVQKSSRHGRVFYGCDQYPKCKCALWDRPVAGPCPKCGNPILVEKYSKKTGETSVACPKKECDYKKMSE